MRASLLASLIKGKVRLSNDYTPLEILKDLQLKMRMEVSYMQCWRALKYVWLLTNGRSDDHYKLLPRCVK